MAVLYITEQGSVVRGKLRGQLTPPKAKNIVLRMRQYELARDCGTGAALPRAPHPWGRHATGAR